VAYATVADLAAWLSPTPAPADAQKRLDRASLVVDEMLLTAVYAVDDNGLPTEAAVITALRDATCAQVEYAAAAGDPASVGAAQYHSMSIGSVALTRGYSGGGSAAAGRYSPIAWSILQQAGLTGQPPWAR
jgi:hypothetical protein